MAKVAEEQRICFGITWFATEEEADKYAQEVKAKGRTYNGGFMDGMPCGRDKGFDRVVDGIKQYAVTD
jgi:hypothetical protein